MNFLYFLGCEVVGYIAIRYSKWITDNTGHIYGVEKYFGAGTTYSFWKVIGILLILFGFFLLFH